MFSERLHGKSGKLLNTALLIAGIAVFFSVGYFIVGPAMTKSHTNSQTNEPKQAESSTATKVKPEISITETTKPPINNTATGTPEPNINDKRKIEPPTKPTTPESPFQPSTPKIVEPSVESSNREIWRVQAGVFSDRKNADDLTAKLNAAGFQTSIYSKAEGESRTYVVQVGAFSNKSKAEAMAEKLRAAGFDAQISTEH